MKQKPPKGSIRLRPPLPSDRKGSRGSGGVNRWVSVPRSRFPSHAAAQRSNPLLEVTRRTTTYTCGRHSCPGARAPAWRVATVTEAPTPNDLLPQAVRRNVPQCRSPICSSQSATIATICSGGRDVPKKATCLSDDRLEPNRLPADGVKTAAALPFKWRDGGRSELNLSLLMLVYYNAAHANIHMHGNSPQTSKGEQTNQLTYINEYAYTFMN